MNKRQKKKRDKKLFQAIKELNEEVAKDFDEPIVITEESLWEAFHRVKKYNSINKVFKSHKYLVG